MDPGLGPFRGQASEIGQVLTACADRGAVVLGRPGSGRTRLAREVAASSAKRGGTVVSVIGTQAGRAFPFGALMGFAGDLDPENYAASARLVLDALEQAGPALLVVDDAHLLDDASAALIHRLAVIGGSPPMLVTVASPADAPDAIAALSKDGYLDVVELGPLSAEDSALVVGDWLGGDVEQATAAHLHLLSEGNPAVLRELVAAAAALAVLAPRAGLWSWRGEVPSSAALVALLDRVHPASEQAIRVLQVLALAEPLGLDQLVALTNLDAATDAEESGLIVVERHRRRTTVRTAHLLQAEVIRAGLGTVRRAELLRTVEAVLNAVPTRRAAEVLKRAEIRLESGRRAPDDATVFTDAARLARPDHGLAERFARAALEAGAGFTALDYLVDALLWQGRVDEAREFASAVGNDASAEERAYFTQRWARMLWFMTGERPPEASEGSEGDLSAPAQLAAAARDAATTAAAGRGIEAIAPALAVLANPGADDEARCWATGAAVIGLGGQGRVGDALTLMPEAYACAQRLTDFNYRLLLSVLDVRLRKLAGDLTGARSSIQQLRHQMGSRPGPNAGLVTLFEADLLLAGGWARRAIPLLRDAAAALDAADFGGLSATAHYLLAQALGLVGDPAGAAARVQQGQAAESRTLDVFRPEQLLAKAWGNWGAGDRPGARVALAQAVEHATGQAERLVEVQIRTAAMRHGDLESARRLLRLAPTVEGAYAASAATHARAMLGGAIPGLLAAADAYLSCGARGEATDALAHAAQAARRAGDEADYRRLAARAEAMAADVGGLDTAALRAVLPGTPLTRRQRDVARLAAAGMSNRDIAERLGVGIRTVESHLDATYRQLGITSRQELVEVFSRTP